MSARGDSVKRPAYFLAVPTRIGWSRGRPYQRRKFFVCTSSLEDARECAAAVPLGYRGWVLRPGALEGRISAAGRLGENFVEISAEEYVSATGNRDLAGNAGARVIIDEVAGALSSAEEL